VTESAPYAFDFPQAQLHQRVSWAALRLERGADRALATIGLSTAKFYILIALGRDPGHLLSPTQIGARLLMERSNLTAILDRMERDGLVAREPNPADRRSLLIRLTERGHVKLDQGAALYEQAIRAMVQGMTEKDMRAVDAILQRLVVLPVESPGPSMNGESAKPATASAR
jgi:DNA-binding MarR family transcriptional regulator